MDSFVNPGEAVRDFVLDSPGVVFWGVRVVFGYRLLFLDDVVFVAESEVHRKD